MGVRYKKLINDNTTPVENELAINNSRFSTGSTGSASLDNLIIQTFSYCGYMMFFFVTRR